MLPVYEVTIVTYYFFKIYFPFLWFILVNFHKQTMFCFTKDNTYINIFIIKIPLKFFFKQIQNFCYQDLILCTLITTITTISTILKTSKNWTRWKLFKELLSYILSWNIFWLKLVIDFYAFYNFYNIFNLRIFFARDLLQFFSINRQSLLCLIMTKIIVSVSVLNELRSKSSVPSTFLLFLCMYLFLLSIFFFFYTFIFRKQTNQYLPH